MSDNGVNFDNISNSSIQAGIIAGRDVIQFTLPDSRPEQNPSSDPTELQFDCGHRLKVVREALGLNPAQFITRIQYPSEKGWNLLEQRELEASEALITHVAALSGVSAQWLRTGEEPMLPFHHHSLKRIASFFELLEAHSTTAVFIVVCDSYEDTHVVAQVDEYAYIRYTFDFGLQFWTWDDAHEYIPLILELLWGLLHRYPLECDVVYIPKRLYHQFEKGEIHPQMVLRQCETFKHFLDDMFYGSGNDMTRKRYGRPFKQMIDYLAKNIENLEYLAKQRFGDYKVAYSRRTEDNP